MSKKYRLKKSAILFFILFLLIIIALIVFIVSLFSSKSYSLEYNIKDYAISENYDKESQVYYYEITYNNKKYNFVDEKKYQKGKKLITGIKKHEYEDYTCLTIESNVINSMPLCSKEDNLISFYLVPEELSNKLDDYINKNKVRNNTYNNYKIYNTDNNVLIWSYKGFNYLKGDDVSFIKVFDKDIYEIPLAAKINNYIVVPDYEQTYEFNKCYIINLNNLKVAEWKLDYTISYDSYILGTNDKSIYLVDKKNSKEYELVPHKKKMRIIASSNKNGIIYKNGVEEKINVNKLVSSKQTFTYKLDYNYILEDKTLYLYYWDKSNKIKVSDNLIRTIVSIDNESVFYLVDNTLYKYDNEHGETKILEYSELEFNYKNLIFINN